MKNKAGIYTGNPGKLTKLQPSLAMDDIIIPIMGPSGVGKSTFINRLAGRDDVVKVGHDQTSCTTELQPVVIDPPSSISLQNRRLVLVDTPGFDETFATESETLRRIASWLANAYSADTKLSGVIYLHDISSARMKGTSVRNLEVFRKLCGDRALRSVLLGTTKWNQLERHSEGEERVKQLRDEFWRAMIEHGSIVHNFEGTPESAWEMVDAVLAQVACDVIIPVIGVTGVGKSKFVNALAGRNAVAVGDPGDIEPCTLEVQPVTVDWPILAHSRSLSHRGRLIVVDTPGFDRPHIEDSATLKGILDDLTSRYGAGTKLGGIIHLHDINRPPHSTFHKYLDEFHKGCAEPKALILGTTKWGRNIKDGQGKSNSNSEQEHRGTVHPGERHLNNLKEGCWKTLIDAGAKVHKFTGSQDSALEMVKEILADSNPHRTEVLQIQEELVRAKKTDSRHRSGQTSATESKPAAENA